MTPRALKHPGRWLWLLLALPVALGVFRLRFDVEVFDLLPGDLPAVKGLKLFQEHFANARELIVTLQGTDRDQTEDVARKVAERLRHETNLVSSVTWQPPWLEHPEQAAELLAYLWFNQPPEALAELTNRLAITKLEETAAAAREDLATSMSPGEIGRLSYDPFGFTRLPTSAMAAAPSFGEPDQTFTSRDGRFRIIFIQASTDLRSYRDCDTWLAALKPLVEQAASSGRGVMIGYTGRPAFVTEVASGMQRDITISVGGTAAIIAVLFWLAHRRVKPMLWLLTLLALILGCTLAMGGLIFGTINVVSMGFAAILLGLAVDYAVVHYQEALAHPNLTIPQIRAAIAPSIFWAAVTTISAFLVLNLGGLPGLAQLGTLVGVGVALAAIIMIFEFLPPLFPERRQANATIPAGVERGDDSAREADAPAKAGRGLLVFGTTAAVALISLIVVVCYGFPRVDPTGDALRPKGSPAYAAMDLVQKNLTQQQDSLWLFVSAPTVDRVAEGLEQAQIMLSQGVSNHLLSGFKLPTPLWPHPEFQRANRPAVRKLASEREELRKAAQSHGFAPPALALTEQILDTWQVASDAEGVFWPTNPMSRWIFEKFAVQTPTNLFAFGVVNPSTNGSITKAQLTRLETSLPKEVLISGWGLLGSEIFERVKSNLWKVVTPMVTLVMLSLYLAFRRPQEIILSVAALGLSGLGLLAVMHWSGWTWNLLNLMGIPLILGTGVDYSIFMQLSLRRHEGNLRMAYQSVGRALLLCGGTAVAGFGSLAMSSNAGMSSLGKVCAVGIAGNVLIAIFLLPKWWTWFAHVPPSRGRQGAVTKPSSLYCSEVWRLGLAMVRKVPRGVCVRMGQVLATVYWRLAHHRRQIVIANLMPALGDDRVRAEKCARALFQQFALKVLDLWRYEAGMAIHDLFGATEGWDRFLEAQAQGRGVLLLTPHLGNWEFGGPLLTRAGFALQVLTLAEPGEGLTRLRQASRARWKIDTLVVGDNPLAFVEIIRRLEAGATVALLVDRPPPPTAVEVELFGRPFAATVAAAELARASGCVLLPTYLVHRNGAYDAKVLPAIPYERAKLRARDARQELTQRIIQAFEPVIRENLDQWYHFVPVWPPEGPTGPRAENGKKS